MLNTLIEKEKMLDEVADWYGFLEIRDGKYVINNYLKEFVYDTVDEALIDWLPTLIGSNEDIDNTMWVKEIEFIKQLKANQK